MWILTSKATKLCTQIGVNAHKGAYKYKVPTVSKEWLLQNYFTRPHGSKRVEDKINNVMKWGW